MTPRPAEPDVRRADPDQPNDPLVSVVVTAYNHADYIGEAVQSVLDQNYPHREIIVVDDGSTDRTREALERFGGRITLISQQNTGVAGARNRGIRAAAGTLLAFLDGDDRWHRDKVRRQVEAFRRFPSAGLVACSGRQFDGPQVLADGLFPGNILKRFSNGDAFSSNDCVEDLIADNLIYTTSQVMIPRRVLDAVGLSDAAFPIASDYDLYLRIAFKYPLAFVNEPLTDWRYLATSASGPSALRVFRWSADALAVLRKHAQFAPARWRPLVQTVLRAKTHAVAKRAYYYGCDVDAKWARAYLWQLLTRSQRPVVAAYLCGMLAPQAVRSIAASRLGRLLGAAD